MDEKTFKELAVKLAKEKYPLDTIYDSIARSIFVIGFKQGYNYEQEKKETGHGAK